MILICHSRVTDQEAKPLDSSVHTAKMGGYGLLRLPNVTLTSDNIRIALPGRAGMHVHSRSNNPNRRTNQCRSM